MSEVKMQYSVVENMSKMLEVAADFAESNHNKLMQVVAAIQSNDEKGLIGDAAAEYYFDQLKTKFDSLIKNCRDMSGDVLGAVKAIRDGDTTASTRFAG
ncbi:MAG: hypothetical protein KF716_32195 [Anaerolineae bacterium]|nr:hypothetical protein [Anaerolineae bacterium]